MAIVSSSTREFTLEDGTTMKFNAGESVDDVVAMLENSGRAVNVF